MQILTKTPTQKDYVQPNDIHYRVHNKKQLGD